MLDAPPPGGRSEELISLTFPLLQRPKSYILRTGGRETQNSDRNVVSFLPDLRSLHAENRPENGLPQKFVNPISAMPQAVPFPSVVRTFVHTYWSSHVIVPAQSQQAFFGCLLVTRRRGSLARLANDRRLICKQIFTDSRRSRLRRLCHS